MLMGVWEEALRKVNNKGGKSGVTWIKPGKRKELEMGLNVYFIVWLVPHYSLFITFRPVFRAGVSWLSISGLYFNDSIPFRIDFRIPSVVRLAENTRFAHL